jgi:polysaccharide biosynthesis protein PslH
MVANQSSSPVQMQSLADVVLSRQDGECQGLEPGSLLKMTMVCHDLPFPANHGARVDMWRRIRAFRRLGVELQLICWGDGWDEEARAELSRVAEQVHVVLFQGGAIAHLSRALGLLSYPLEVTSRIIRGRALRRLSAAVRQFQPDVIWLDGLHGGELATRLSRDLEVPLVMRSHNIEHLYYRRLLASATGWGKLRRQLSLLHLEQFERSVLERSAVFYDISMDDLNFWQSQGFKQGRYLPPLVDFSLPPEGDLQPDYDVVFLGNLCSDNNVAGVTWFVNEVMPLMQAQLPDVRVLIAGSNPVRKILDLCGQRSGITLRVNPTDAAAVYRSGRVLINPVKAGSGVSIKSIEMLAAGRSIVSTAQGTAGLPDCVKPYFKIAIEAQSFATEIIQLLSASSPPPMMPMEQLEALFGERAIATVLEEVQALVRSDRSQGRELA